MTQTTDNSKHARSTQPSASIKDALMNVESSQFSDTLAKNEDNVTEKNDMDIDSISDDGFTLDDTLDVTSSAACLTRYR